MIRRFFISFLLVTAVFGGFAAANFALVYLAGETTAYSDIARMQQENPGTLYGPLFNDNHGAYKYALLAARPHDIVVVGSSRALRFKQVFFNRPMVNCGRAMSSVRSALNFFDRMADEPPKSILVLADFWWFRDPLREVTGGHEFSLPTGSERSLDMFYEPASYVLTGKIDPMPVVEGSPILGGRQIGFRALERGSGFQADGSILDPGRQTQSEMEATVRTRIGATEFKFHDRLEKGALDAFFAGVDRLRGFGHKVTVIFPPVSPAMTSAVWGDSRYGYVQKTLEYAGSKGAFDYTDLGRLGLTVDEFADDLHTTSRGDAIILRDLAGRSPEVAEVLDLKVIEAFLATGKDAP